jgi:histidinol dehydrogenase
MTRRAAVTIPVLAGAAARARVARLAGRFGQLPARHSARVDEILSAVRERGDRAVAEMTRRFDGVELAPERFRVTRAEVQEARLRVSLEFLKALDLAADNIERYHRCQVERSWMMHGEDGELLGLVVSPVDSVGAYVPGGTAGTTPLISTALMCVIPARVAGVRRIAVASPPRADGTLDPHLVVALDRVGAAEVYKVGGAQAVAALAFGTGTIRRVDKIVGPGNVWVALAKRAVYGLVDVDKIAGPSEVVVLADATARPDFIASDLLAQAEHDPMAIAVAITPDERLARRIAVQVRRQAARLSRAATIAESLAGHGAVLVAGDMDRAIDAVNAIAPEHLEIMTADPHSLLPRIRFAGAIFLGGQSPQALGDYVAGPNHTLPTAGTARWASPLGVWDFVRRTTITSYTPAALARVSRAVDTLAHLEGLDAHAASVRIRLPVPSRPRPARTGGRLPGP